MFSIEKQAGSGTWEPVPLPDSETYDLTKIRHKAESLAETSGIPHRVVNERRSVLFCSGCGEPGERQTARQEGQ